MFEVGPEDLKLKALFKAAMLELLEERKDLLREIVEETLEEIALARAIEAGQRAREVSRSEAFPLLDGSR
jgi:hypothetical protein